MRRAALLVLVGLVAAGLATPSSAVDAQGVPTFRIVIIPDTQIYSISDQGAAVATAQLQWAVDRAVADNIVFVTHVGDVVDTATDAAQWDRMETGFALLDASGLPYAIAPGNHDLVLGGGPVPYDTRFAATRFSSEQWYGAAHPTEGNRSSWQEVDTGVHQVLFIHARHLLPAYGDIGATLTWIDDLLASHPDHLVFVTTHQFTETDGSIGIPALADVLDDHCNVAAVFSGHRLGEAVRGTFDDGCGRSVHHIMTNYQFIQNGGDGYLRTIDIDPFTLEMVNAVYSPTADAFRTGADEAFTASLAKLPPVVGDLDCDRDRDVVDALRIAQFGVGLLIDHGSCPLPLAAGQVDTSAADVNGDEAVTIVDALVIAQCEVGLVNELCGGG